MRNYNSKKLNCISLSIQPNCSRCITNDYPTRCNQATIPGMISTTWEICQFDKSNFHNMQQITRLLQLTKICSSSIRRLLSYQVLVCKQQRNTATQPYNLYIVNLMFKQTNKKKFDWLKIEIAWAKINA